MRMIFYRGFFVIFGFIFWSFMAVQSVFAGCGGRVTCGHVSCSSWECSGSSTPYASCSNVGDKCGTGGVCVCTSTGSCVADQAEKYCNTCSAVSSCDDGTANYCVAAGSCYYYADPTSPPSCTPNCNCAANICVGDTCRNSCNTADCPGTKVDESLTYCGAITKQYSETPQTTGTVWARVAGCSSYVNSVYFPTWNTYNGQDDLVWYDGANIGTGTWEKVIDITKHQPTLGNTINVDVYDNGICRPVVEPYKEIVGGTTIKITPKTCAVTINTSGAVSSQANGINVTATGNAHINPGIDSVRVWITRNDMGVIPGGVTYDYGPSTGIPATQKLFDGYYYSIDNAYKNSVDAANTSATFTVHAPPGNYRVHCDLPNDLNDLNGNLDLVKCSGNPTCSFNFNGGSTNCALDGWKSCSDNDWAPFKIVSPPTFTSLIIKNADSGVVAGESGGTTFRNHICQTTFQNTINPPRRVIFEANVNDLDGAADITTATLTWKGNNYPMTKISGAGTAATMQATINFVDSDNATGLFDLFVTATDSYGASSGLVNTDRDWKVWDCQVPVVGTLYDDSSQSAAICTSDWTTMLSKLSPVVGFNALKFTNTTSPYPSVLMTPNSPAAAEYLSPIGAGLIWGKSYISVFNNGSYPTPDNPLGDLLASGINTKIADLGRSPNVIFCPIGQTFNIGDRVDPYSTTPKVRIDFSFIQDQEAWYQVVGAGVKGKEEVESGVPVTALEPALTLSTVNNINGLVSSKVFKNNINGCSESTCVWGNPNNWYLKQNTNDLVIYDYGYFYNNFFVKAGVGSTGTDWDSKPPNGIYFVKKDLNIDSDFVLDDPLNTKTMMVIVNGNINIDKGVKNLDGIYIANGSISAGGISDDQLVINGMLYARRNVTLNRSFAIKTTNNDTPAVKVNYSPGLIFKLDPKILRVLSGWREE